MDRVITSESLRHAEYYDMMEVFDNLYAKSLNGEIFKNLMNFIISDDNILLAYRNIKQNAGSKTKGIDKQTICDIKELESTNFLKIIKEMFEQYTPKPVRRVDIPKGNGKTRPLGIPTIWDRMIQQCILQILEPICEAKFNDRSYGFRPNKSAHHALAKSVKYMQLTKLSFVVDIDIKGFFDNVNHSKLIKQMWTLGIRDKSLLGIIRAMLNSPIIHPNGKVEHPKKGTPQGGILSPLLANIVLNELDWWVTSQWEDIPTRHNYDWYHKEKKYWNKGNKFRALRTTKLKEMYMVRYADDFKIFCRKRSDADKIFIATKDWLKKRLSLDISEEKSRVVNLKKQTSEFLGFELKLVRKRKTVVVESHMSEKSRRIVSDKLVKQIKNIQHAFDAKDLTKQISLYNSMVMGMHQYYKKATHISVDFPKINQRIRIVSQNRLELQSTGKLPNSHIQKHYAKSKQIRWINNQPILPVGYVKHSYTSLPKSGMCKYTEEGRKLIHQYLDFPTETFRNLRNKQHNDETVEFVDNRLSKFSAQRGKCGVSKQYLEYENIYCHRILPSEYGGTDNYQNLIVVHRSIHKIIHSSNLDEIDNIIRHFRLNEEQIRKFNELRIKARQTDLTVNLETHKDY